MRGCVMESQVFSGPTNVLSRCKKNRARSTYEWDRSFLFLELDRVGSVSAHDVCVCVLSVYMMVQAIAEMLRWGEEKKDEREKFWVSMHREGCI